MRSMPSSPSPGRSGGSDGGGVRPPPLRPAETVVTALGESATVPVEVIYVSSEAVIENSPFPQPAMAASYASREITAMSVSWTPAVGLAGSSVV